MSSISANVLTGCAQKNCHRASLMRPGRNQVGPKLPVRHHNLTTRLSLRTVRLSMRTQASSSSSPEYFVRTPLSEPEADYGDGYEMLPMSERPPQRQGLGKKEGLYKFSGCVEVDSVEYKWELQSMPENVVLSLVQDDRAQDCKVFFDAKEVKKDVNDTLIKGRTISEKKIRDAVIKASELGWGTWSSAKTVSFNGEQL